MSRPVVLALLLASAAASAQPSPATDYATLLSTRFYAHSGQFAFDSPGPEFVLFPPSAREVENSAYLVRDAAGEIVGGRLIGRLGTTGASAIGTLQFSAAPEWSRTLEDGGRYTLDVILDRQTIGSIPFTAAVVQSGDPYNPGQSYRLDGPWRTHAYFEHETERPDYLLHFNAWIGEEEISGGGPTEVSIRRGGEEVAFGTGYADLNYDWSRVEYDLFHVSARDPQSRFARSATNGRRWNVQDVTPGTYEIAISSEAGPFRTLTIEGADGAFVPHARSAVDYEPRARFLTSRKMQGQNLSRSHTLYWIAPAE